MVSGSKRLALFHPARKYWIERKSLCGWVDAQATGHGYGAYGGPPFLDVEALDVARYPTWLEMEWWEAELHPGDCIFIPTAWYHHVDTAPGRSIAVNFWWWRRDGVDDEERSILVWVVQHRCRRAERRAATRGEGVEGGGAGGAERRRRGGDGCVVVCGGRRSWEGPGEGDAGGSEYELEQEAGQEQE